MGKEVVLEIRNLNIAFRQYDDRFAKKDLETIRKLDVSVRKGEMVAIVGSSGSGKSLLAHGIMGILPYNATMSGDIIFDGLALDDVRRKELVGKEIVIVPQSLSYLDPLQKIGKQILVGRETGERKRKLDALFKRYHLPEKVKKLYPFELSGGMQRRVLVSTAVMENPRLVIADEPTPNLDFELAKRVMAHFRELANGGSGVLVITHDLELALETCDRVVIFNNGMSVHECKPEQFSELKYEEKSFARDLYLAYEASGDGFGENMVKGSDVVLSAEDISFSYEKSTMPIFDEFSLDVLEGERVGIFAPSGRGKTTLCKLLSGYEKPLKGKITYKGENVYDYEGYCPVQMIWQEQNLAVNPRMKMSKVLAEGDGIDERIVGALGIRKEWLERFPSELSGGEVQRFCIARALGLGTKVLIADEITTMMDLVSRRKIWEFLIEETQRRKMSVIVVSHDRKLLEGICDRIVEL